jgi:hypothetical protein
MNSNTPTAPSGSFYVDQQHTTPQAPCDFYAGKFLNIDDDSLL